MRPCRRSGSPRAQRWALRSPPARSSRRRRAPDRAWGRGLQSIAFAFARSSVWLSAAEAPSSTVYAAHTGSRVAVPDEEEQEQMPKSPQVGEQAPDFELAGTDGAFRLSEHRGERVVLLFYPG